MFVRAEKMNPTQHHHHCNYACMQNIYVAKTTSTAAASNGGVIIKDNKLVLFFEKQNVKGFYFLSKIILFVHCSCCCCVLRSYCFPRRWPVQVEQSHHVQRDDVQLLAHQRRQTGHCPSKLSVHQLLDISAGLRHHVHNKDTGLVLNQTCVHTVDASWSLE